MMNYAFGVDVGGTSVKLALFDESGEPLGKWEIPTRTDCGGSAILPDIAASMQAHLYAAGVNKRDVLGVGIGVPGPVDAHGVVNKCVNLGWGVFNIREQLGALTGLPVLAGNDANVAALGEAWRGGAAGYASMVLVTLGTGVGGGIVLGGSILHGAHGTGGEIGHLTLNRHETERCTCGKFGCAEQYCSATGIVRMAKRRLAACDTPSALRAVGELTCKDVFDASASGDALASELLEAVYELLAELIADVCCVVDPEIVVLGGGVSRAGQPLLEGVRRYYPKYCFHAARDTRFALARLGNDAGCYGAARMVLAERGKN